MKVEFIHGDELHGAHPVLTWLRGQAHLPPYELCVHLPGGCCGQLETSKAYQGPVKPRLGTWRV